LHGGEAAVAAWKPMILAGGLGGDGAFPQGEPAVAALNPLDGPPVLGRARRSPRRNRRGRIEATPPASWSIPARPVLHGGTAVAALKHPRPQDDRQGAGPFSTAEPPWPH